ncbi:unnamed protein product [Vitrella brassicaformis CCMP3155]|uniref:tRNA (guanine(9)-N(1))-methyltransferase n=1 Tax=Vitrella brassicaformis (strain CCMP3155) TaxID=1169540 RepID=A0A0G4F0U2_VITBC|nr:unnamed protein product [Vitrella brassicaformis CCMP3155]|eukprot:CEM05241.1 unnamed protein product [Vitrella brassicaformis CCMP3155]
MAHIEAGEDADFGSEEAQGDGCQPEGDQLGSAYDASGASGGPVLSKSQQKKKRKHERYLQRKTQRKIDRKAKRRKNKQPQTVDDGAAAAVDDGEPQPSIAPQENSSASREPSERKRRMNEEFVAKCADAPTVVIDCEFEHLQTDREVSSLAQQIFFSYGANRRAQQPVRILISGIREGSRYTTHFNKISGFATWPAVETISKPYIEHIEKERLVYLTADSPMVIDELDNSKAYIIGGIVDRNRYKNLTLNKATEQGIAAARLPLDSNIRMTSSKVLAANHVLEILLKWLECRDWAVACSKGVPQRKTDGISEGGEGPAQEGEEADDCCAGAGQGGEAGEQEGMCGAGRGGGVS